MISLDLRKTLIEIANQEEEESRIAKIIAFYLPNLDFSSRESLFDSLMKFYQLSENQIFDFSTIIADLKKDENLIDVEPYKGKDYRIKNIEISNLRGIPSLEEHSNIPFGINLLNKDGNLNNAIVLANNGTGKSSIFAGLEMIYDYEIGEKNLRTENPGKLKKDDYFEYLIRFPNRGTPICKIETLEGSYDLNSKIFSHEVVKVLNPKNHFITEFDIIDNGRIDFTSNYGLDRSFHNIVARNVGLQEYLNLIKILEQIPTYSRRIETTNRNKIRDDIKSNKENIKNRTELIQSKKIEKEKLEQGIDISKVNKLTENLQTLRRLANNNFEIKFDENEWKTILDKYLNDYRNYLSYEIDPNKSKEITFLNSGKELLKDSNNCPFCLSSTKTIEEIRENIEFRLKEYEALEKVERDIRESYRNVSRLLWTCISDLINIYKKITSERSELAEFPSFDGLIDLEGKLFLELSPQINDDQLNDIFLNLYQTQFPQKKEYGDLYSLLNNNKQIFSTTYPYFLKQTQTLVNKRKRLIDEEIERLTTNNQAFSIQQKIESLSKEINDLEISIPVLEQQTSDLQIKLIDAEKKVRYYEAIKKDTVKFNLKFNEKKDAIISEAFLPIKEIIEDILNDFVDDDENIKLEIKLEDKTYTNEGIEYINKIIAAKVIDKQTGKSISPDIYFNTFRYKIFSLMVGLSFALSNRVKYRINLPLILDDLFYASDFVNKHAFAKFLQKIIKLFNNFTPELPLQFVLFTHDDVVFEMAIDGIEHFKSDISESSYVNEHTKVFRLFNPIDKAESFETFENGKSFWNLLYKLPKNFIYK